MALSKQFNKLKFTSKIDQKSYSVDVGYEAFLGPEMFFHPEFIDKNYRNSIDQCIDNAIQSSPIDCRKRLYGNINLSGGSTLFSGFVGRLQKNLD